MVIVDMPRNKIPDMQMVEQDIAKALARVDWLLDSMEFVHYVDKDLLHASKNNLSALRSTIQLAIRVDR